MTVAQCVELADKIAGLMKTLPEADKVEVLNAVHRITHAAGPFKDEPIGAVEWVPARQVQTQDTPNTMDSRAKASLRRSLDADGFLQPVVIQKGSDRVVDGKARLALVRSERQLRDRLHGYVPAVRMRAGKTANDLRASHHRINVARGRSSIQKEASAFAALLADGWDLERIANECGYEADAVIRMQQLSGGGGVLDFYDGREFGRAHRMVDEP